MNNLTELITVNPKSVSHVLRIHTSADNDKFVATLADRDLTIKMHDLIWTKLHWHTLTDIQKPTESQSEKQTTGERTSGSLYSFGPPDRRVHWTKTHLKNQELVDIMRIFMTQLKITRYSISIPHMRLELDLL
jgi:hypothetical protein